MAEDDWLGLDEPRKPNAPARIARDEAAVLSDGEQLGQEAAGLADAACGQAAHGESGDPFLYDDGPQPAEWHVAEHRQDRRVDQACVSRRGLRLQVRHGRQAPLRPLADRDLPQPGIRPGGPIEVRLDLRQEPRRLSLRRVRVRPRLLDPIATEIADLPTSGRQPADATESATTSHPVTRPCSPLTSTADDPASRS